jgi:hypothetical protein
LIVANVPACVSAEDLPSLHFFLGPCRCRPVYHRPPIESNVSPEPQARHRLAATRAGFFIDPRFEKLEPRGDFFGCENVFGLKTGACVER